MSSSNNVSAETLSPLERLQTALTQASSSGKSRLEQDFRQAYPLLEQHIARKMRKKLLMEQFNLAFKHEVSLVQFRKLLSAERARRNAEDDALTCSACGRPLCPSVDSTTATTTGEDA